MQEFKAAYTNADNLIDLKEFIITMDILRTERYFVLDDDELTIEF